MGRQRAVVVIRWIARIWGTLAALLWGAFFIEHLEWFTSKAGMPPASVWSISSMHFAMIVALLAAWRYERLGGAVALIASTAFFAAAAGPRFLPLLATTAPPAVAFIYCGVRSRRSPSAT